MHIQRILFVKKNPVYSAITINVKGTTKIPNTRYHWALKVAQNYDTADFGHPIVCFFFLSFFLFNAYGLTGSETITINRQSKYAYTNKKKQLPTTTRAATRRL